MTRARDRDLTGKRFGTIVAVADTGRTHNRSRVWRFRCDCGQEDDLSVKDAQSGAARKNGCRHTPSAELLRHDVTGERFGRLVGVRDVGASKKGGRLWLFACDCGREEEMPLTCVTGKSHQWRACSHCRAKRCVVCGTLILHPTGRTQTTCSAECRMERARRVAREGAARRRATPEGMAAKRRYTDKHKQENPELYRGYAARSRERIKAVRATDPEARRAAAEAQRGYDQEHARKAALRALMQEGAALEDRTNDG